MFQWHGRLPIYGLVKGLDNCNFASRTIWEGDLAAGRTFRYHPLRRPGTQYVAEAASLPDISDGRYEFLLSSHVLEHLADPMKALREWRRILAPGGTLVLIVPHKAGTFDHRRPVTSFAHLLEDEANRTEEDDLTHLEEVLTLHDHARDPAAGGPEAFRARCEANTVHRAMHHHAFDTELVVRALDHAGFQIREVGVIAPFHITAVAVKPREGETVDNRGFLADDATWRRTSPFTSDRSTAAI